ncbi:MAG: hypothetical protein ACE5H8_00175 [Alphaproteobacteria bacterium]
MQSDYSTPARPLRERADRETETTLFMLNCYDIWSASQPARFDCRTAGE